MNDYFFFVTIFLHDPHNVTSEFSIVRIIALEISSHCNFDVFNVNPWKSYKNHMVPGKANKEDSVKLRRGS